MKSRRNFRKKTKSRKSRKERKYTYAHKKRRRTRTRNKTKRSQARTRHRTKQSQAGVNDKDENPCEENNASLDELIREKNCDNVEGHIEGQTIGEGKGYCSGKNCISEDSIESIRANIEGKKYQDPFTRKYLSLEKYDAEREKRPLRDQPQAAPWLKTIKKNLNMMQKGKKSH